ncbi:hypothetical protein [uncultured Dokdonia sp.]|uniref:hypothetical protein n=1 Tax=uncultured Dokdonia sp. TaxID=575653 RepID=UPI00260CCAC5|nr:hypothetical protein [uncultured Dokdonia sp.]
MKTLYTLTALLLLTHFTYAQELKEIDDISCDTADLPEKFTDLNTFAPLMYNLNEDCLFQPLHIEMGDSVSFTIIGRFTGEKINDNVFELNRIEFSFYEAAKFQRPIIVKKAWIDEDHDGNEVVINVELEDISKCFTLNCKGKTQQKKQGATDFDLKTGRLNILSKTKIDFHIVNQEDIFGINPKDVFPKGRHCNGFVIF